jgi:hypothetical protein
MSGVHFAFMNDHSCEIVHQSICRAIDVVIRVLGAASSFRILHLG